MVLSFLLFSIVLLLNDSTGELTKGFESYEIQLRNTENALMTGGKLILDEREKVADNIILNYKKKEIEDGMKNPNSFAPGLHFFKAKEIIERSEIFKIIKLLPKGALLHGHSTSLVSSEWIIKNFTYYPNVMKCLTDKGEVIFKLNFNIHKKNECKILTSVSEERKNAKDVHLYDAQLEELINLYTRYPEMEYQDINVVWNKFQSMFDKIKDLIKYLPLFKVFFWRILEEAYEDGVMYLEIRTSVGSLYDKTGRKYSSEEVVMILQKINDKFVYSHQNFIGFKIIYSVSRSLDSTGLSKKIETFRKLYSKHPDFIIGFDFVGQEDVGPSLRHFHDLVKSFPPGVKFFFHAGETNWYNTIDYNLLDALLWNTTRIGHGYALVKHPVLWNAIKERDIAIEINPLSNQILHLVQDLRNHPAAFYVSENIPIIISSDDPGFWNAKGLSYDFYYAFMCFTSNETGLKFLKQLVLNSIKYSILTNDERKRATEIFTRQWSEFLTKVTTGKKIK